VTSPGYLDTLGLWEATATQPERNIAALASSVEVLDNVVLPAASGIHSVVVFGMGPGATAADLVAAHCAERSSIPVSVGNGYECPAFVGPHTLAFAVSPSGDTEETAAAAAAAVDQGAHLVVVAGGGALAELAASSGSPRFAVPDIEPAARAALGVLAIPVLATLARLGVIDDVGPSLHGALASWQQRRDVLMTPGGPADEVARLIGRTIPLVYGSTGVTAVAARHWKTQVNENAKTPAFAAVQPELSHNEVAGWGQHGDVTRQVLTLLTLRHAAEHPQVARRFDLVVEATDEVMANVIPVWAQGDDDLARFFDLALFGDFVSLHLAGREGIDPGPTPALRDVEAGLRL